MRRFPTRAAAAAIALAVAGLLAGCQAASAGTPAASSTSSAGALHGSLTVFAAASLTDSFNDLAKAFENAHPGVTVKPIDYDGSSTLATQIIAGAPADVFASADQANMKRVTDQSLAAAAPRIFVRNVLQIAVAPGNPKHIAKLSDLANPALKVVLCQPAVPCGAAALTLLDDDHVSVKAVSEEQNVTAVVTKVSSGNADAGLVYVTDVKASDGRVSGVRIPDADKAINNYVIAPLKNAPDPAVAKAFTAFVLSPAGRAVFAKYGFLAP